MSYANPDALVTTDWLAHHLSNPNLRIVDASYFVPGGVEPARQQYAEGHIPGAQFFDVNAAADLSKPKDHAFPTAAIFADYVGKLGIGNGHHVIAYDHLDGTLAARVWFMFRAFNHRNVAVLDGGRTKWAAEGQPFTQDVPQFPPASFNAVAQPNLLKSQNDIFVNISAQAFQVLDARAKGRFEGTAPEPRAGLRSGHIPASCSLPSADLIDPATKTWRDAAALRQAFTHAHIDLSQPLTTTCGSGITACALALGAYLLGKTDTAIYDGSWMEWGADRALPLATGP